jgi:hypothetical protein
MNLYRFGVAAILAMPLVAAASYPTLTANSTYVNVDMRIGADGQAADSMPVFYTGRMEKDTYKRGDEGQRLCARREAYPGSPGSGWSMWVCASSFKGIQVGEPSNSSF